MEGGSPDCALVRPGWPRVAAAPAVGETPGVVQLRVFRPDDGDAVIRLWQECGLTRPWNDPRKDLARKAGVQPELFLVAEDGGGLVGSVMAGWDGHRGWLSFLAVDPSRQGSGIGRLLVAEAERRLAALGCPKAMLMVRGGNEAVLGFYAALGYGREDVVVLGRRLIPDD